MNLKLSKPIFLLSIFAIASLACAQDVNNHPQHSEPVNPAGMDEPSSNASKPLSATDWKPALHKQYENKIVTWRVSIPESGGHYNAYAKLLDNEAPGTWIYSGTVRIKKIDVKDNQIQFQLIPVLPNGDMFGIPRDVSIDLGEKSYFESDIQALMAQFCQDDKPSLQRTQSEYRRYSAEKEEQPTHVGDGVTFPRAIYTPEPKFSLEARRAKYGGIVVGQIVVDKNGRVSQIGLLRTLGMGLDAEAVKTLMTWRFSPGKKDGRPVAVTMNVEVAFNLY